MNKVVRRLIIWAVFTIVAGFAALVVIQYQQSPSTGNGKAYKIDRADVDVAVQPDASLRVTERLKFIYSGSFSGAYRDIPFEPGVTISRVALADVQNGTYIPGGRTSLGSDDAPGKFGTEMLSGTDDNGKTVDRGIRIVWHYAQQGGDRTFTLSYTVRGVTDRKSTRLNSSH